MQRVCWLCLCFCVIVCACQLLSNFGAGAKNAKSGAAAGGGKTRVMERVQGGTVAGGLTCKM